MPQTFSEPLREPRCYITLHLHLRLHLCCGLLTFKEVMTPSLRCPPFIMINTILITLCKFTPSWKAACCLMDRKSMGAGTHKEPRVSATSIPATCSTVFLIFPHQYHDKAQSNFSLLSWSTTCFKLANQNIIIKGKSHSLHMCVYL